MPYVQLVEPFTSWYVIGGYLLAPRRFRTGGYVLLRNLSEHFVFTNFDGEDDKWKINQAFYHDRDGGLVVVCDGTDAITKRYGKTFFFVLFFCFFLFLLLIVLAAVAAMTIKRHGRVVDPTAHTQFTLIVVIRFSFVTFKITKKKRITTMSLFFELISRAIESALLPCFFWAVIFWIFFMCCPCVCPFLESLLVRNRFFLCLGNLRTEFLLCKIPLIIKLLVNQLCWFGRSNYTDLVDCLF